MHRDEDEDKLLRSVALQNARAVLRAREASERALISSNEALERKTAELAEARDELEKRVKERTQELEDANENLGKLSASLLRAQDDEQRRIARELHDSVGQLLVGISMNISFVQSEAHKLSPSVAKCVSDNAQLLEQVTREIRTLSHLLHPPLLDEAGLASAIRWYIEGFADRSKIDVKLDIPSDFGRLPNDAEIAIFRVIQECLTNIHRHSDSRTATILIKRDGEYLTAEVSDTGQGDPYGKAASADDLRTYRSWTRGYARAGQTTRRHAGYSIQRNRHVGENSFQCWHA